LSWPMRTEEQKLTLRHSGFRVPLRGPGMTKDGGCTA
jgi:hypothetical protein